MQDTLKSSKYSNSDLLEHLDQGNTFHGTGSLVHETIREQVDEIASRQQNRNKLEDQENENILKI